MVVAGALATGIFIFDTVSPLQFAVAVLYVIVIFMAAISYQRRGVLMAASGCIALTILSPYVTRSRRTDSPVRRAEAPQRIAVRSVR